MKHCEKMKLFHNVSQFRNCFVSTKTKRSAVKQLGGGGTMTVFVTAPAAAGLALNQLRGWRVRDVIVVFMFDLAK